MKLNELKVGQDVRSYVPLTPSAAMEIKGKIRGINDGKIAIDFINNKNESETVEVRPVDVMEVL